MASINDWHALYPFKSHEIRLDGHRYHYLDEGPQEGESPGRADGEVLLLVHGNPTWSFFWREIVLALCGRYRLVVPDHIGCGLSDKPPETAYSYRMAQRIDDLGSLIERLNLRRITLLAHDWGGAIGMGAAVAAPERFARFVLFNTGAFRGQRCPWRIRLCRTPLLGRLAVEGLNLFARAAIRMAVCRPERMTRAVRAGLLAPYDRWKHRVAIRNFVDDIPLRAGHPSYSTLCDVENGLAKFAHHPACLIWGMRDWCFTPAFLERFIEFFPEAEVHRLADAGHYVVEDAFERIVPLVEDFLQSNSLLPQKD